MTEEKKKMSLQELLKTSPEFAEFWENTGKSLSKKDLGLILYGFDNFNPGTYEELYQKLELVPERAKDEWYDQRSYTESARRRIIRKAVFSLILDDCHNEKKRVVDGLSEQALCLLKILKISRDGANSELNRNSGYSLSYNFQYPHSGNIYILLAHEDRGDYDPPFISTQKGYADLFKNVFPVFSITQLNSHLYYKDGSDRNSGPFHVIDITSFHQELMGKLSEESREKMRKMSDLIWQQDMTEEEKKKEKERKEKNEKIKAIKSLLKSYTSTTETEDEGGIVISPQEEHFIVDSVLANEFPLPSYNDGWFMTKYFVVIACHEYDTEVRGSKVIDHTTRQIFVIDYKNHWVKKSPKESRLFRTTDSGVVSSAYETNIKNVGQNNQTIIIEFKDDEIRLNLNNLQEIFRVDEKVKEGVEKQIAGQVEKIRKAGENRTIRFYGPGMPQIGERKPRVLSGFIDFIDSETAIVKITDEIDYRAECDGYNMYSIQVRTIAYKVTPNSITEINCENEWQ